MISFLEKNTRYALVLNNRVTIRICSQVYRQKRNGRLLPGNIEKYPIMSSPSLDRSDNSALRYPHLRGKFACASCGQEFVHAASLRRHRISLKCSEQTCQLCDQQIEKQREAVHIHMVDKHNIPHVFCCSCCNWAFAEKRLLSAHQKSMRTCGLPGDATPVAKGTNPPGSLWQDGPPKPSSPICKTPKRKSSVNSLCSSSFSSLQSSRASSSSPPPQPSIPSAPDPPVSISITIPSTYSLSSALELALKSSPFKGDEITDPENWTAIVTTAILLAKGPEGLKKLDTELLFEEDEQNKVLSI
ncbi:unnamed protein product [Caenorhabditis sp. 36 PRJEB53466]|nr:unnamed protein product [Caenorhabditis sp. 36 PRJEB53466]